MTQRYELLERIATGGMAEIYRARMFGASGFEKQVVVKKILQSFTRDPEFVEMFIEEAKLASHLQHGNIVQVYDLGTTSGNDYFIVMEYVNGRDLGDLIYYAGRRKVEIGIRESVFIAKQVCAGLDYAHRKLDDDGEPLGIIHRDVSPQNVVLSFEGEVKLTDFGIAKARNRRQETQVGLIKGKYGYMSPEQARSGKLDSRSDIFNVGILLYELLIGERLFEGTSDFSTLNLMRSAAVVSPKQLRGDIPEGLDEIVMKALAAEPKDRYQSAADMDRALTRFSFEMSLVASATDIARLMKRIFGKPKSGVHDPSGTRVIDLQDVSGPSSELVGADKPNTVALGAGSKSKSKPKSRPKPTTVGVDTGGSGRVERPARSLPRGVIWLLNVAVLGATASGVAILAWPPPASNTSVLRDTEVERAAAAQVPAATTILVLIESNPSGAQVLIDRARADGRTPVFASLAADGEPHEVEIRKQGYRRWKGTVSVPKGRLVGEVTADLQRMTGELVLAAPPSATLSLDGQDLGAVKPRMQIPRGKHVVIVSLDGHLPWRAEIDLQARRKLKPVFVPLDEAGTITLVTRPKGALVRWSAGTARGGETFSLRAGTRRLSIEAPGHPARTLVVQVKAGQTTRVYVDLMVTSGT